MIKTTIYNFYTSLYIAEIQKLMFHIPHVQIMVTNHCGYSRRNAFKYPDSFQDVVLSLDYAERVIPSFTHQI